MKKENLNNNLTREIHEWILDFHQYGKKDSPLISRALNLLVHALTTIEELQKVKSNQDQNIITNEKNI